MANEAENPEVSDDAAEGATAKKPAAKKKSVAKKRAAKKPAARKVTARKVAAKKPAARKIGTKKIDVKGLAEALGGSAEGDAPDAGSFVGKPIAVRAVAAKPKTVVAKEGKKTASREEYTGPAAKVTSLSSVRKSDVTYFLRQLIMLLKAGTPILRSLQTLSKRGEKANVRALVADITQYVEAGNPLWQAFDRHSRYFDRVFVNLIKASEASGTLITVLERVVASRTELELMRKRVKAAMFYPAILVFACGLVTWLISSFVIPEFKDMFSKADIEIKGMAKFLFDASDTVSSYWWLPLIIALALFVGYKFAVGRSQSFRLLTDGIKLRIPVMGPIVKGSALVELTRTMALLIRSGVPMMATLELTRSSVGNLRVAQALQGVRDSIERGGGMEAPLRKAAPAIPHVVTDMLVTGEESGRVDEVADQVADIYEKDVEILTGGLGEALQPIFTVIVGVGILFLFVALFGPLVELIEQLGSAGA